MEPRVLRPGDAHRTLTARASIMHFKAVAAIDDGELLAHGADPASWRQTAPPHRHLNCSEAYFVLDGTVTATIDGRNLVLEREGFVLVRRGAAHTFGDMGELDARLLVIHAPAMDAYFAALHDLWSGTSAPTLGEERALMSRHGMEPA